MAEQGVGLMESGKRLFGTLSSIVSARLELLANELQEERLYLTQMFFYFVAAFFCFGLAVLLLTAFVVVLFWEDHHLAVLGGLGVLFFVLGTLAVMLLRSKELAKPRLFSASLAELVKDRDRLGSSRE